MIFFYKCIHSGNMIKMTVCQHDCINNTILGINRFLQLSLFAARINDQYMMIFPKQIGIYLYHT